MHAMPLYFAFLRAINVGGHTVTMARLREVFESLGFFKVETFIASGNVVFEADETKTKALETRIEKGLRDALGYEVVTFIRTPSEVAAIAAYAPFPAEAMAQAKGVNVAFLRDEISAETTQKLMGLKTEFDDFLAHGREVYWLCRTRQSDSKISNVLLEKSLGLRMTIRGENTVKKMAAKWGEMSA